MNNVYMIDFASDVIRGQHNFGERRLLENLSLDQVKNQVSEYSNKFGKPSRVAGMLVWIDAYDSYCLSIYKNNAPFELPANS